MEGVIHLDPTQSISIHGWLNPKRTLGWKDICKGYWISVKTLVDAGISQKQMIYLQPDIHAWIQAKDVSFHEVPYMTSFPLDPIVHLKGDISTLVQQAYSSQTLQEIGMTYSHLVHEISMDASWMRMFSFTPAEWVRLGMTYMDIDHMSDGDAKTVFGMTKTELKLVAGLSDSVARSASSYNAPATRRL